MGLDELYTIVEYGTDMLVIEKEGTAIQVSPYSNNNRIALLNTRGFAVEYASDLARLASEKGCNISCLVDWDISGLLIFMKLRKIIPSIKRIGVDKNTVKKLGLDSETVGESYEASNNHLKPLTKILYDLYNLAEANKDSEKIAEYSYLIQNLDDLESTRIEINSITYQLNDNQRFWELIEDEIRKAFPNRVFTRSYTIPEYVPPSPLTELNDFFESKGKPVLAERTPFLKNKLANSGIKNAFLFDRTNKQLPDYNADRYDLAIEGQSRMIIEKHSTVKPDVEDVAKLLKRLKVREKKRLKGGGAR